MSVTTADTRGLGTPREVVVYQSEGLEAQVYSYDSTNGLTWLDSTPFRGPETHTPSFLDVTGDGRDDVLSNGVLDLANDREWYYCSYNAAQGLPGYCGNFSDDHTDGAYPMGDVNDDGVLDLVLVDNEFTKIASSVPAGAWPMGSTVLVDEPSLIAHHQRVHTPANPFPRHGQAIAVGRFIDGIDACGVEGFQVLSTPKGLPGNSTGSGSFLANQDLNILIASNGILNGPSGFAPRVMDWDGDRSRDEAMAPRGEFLTVYEAELSGGTNCGAGGTPDPINGSTYDHAYRWTLAANRTINSSWYAQQPTTIPIDFFGDSREEVVSVCTDGLFILYNSADNPLAGYYLEPWASEAYRRRYAEDGARFIDFQDLPVLERVSVSPTTLGMTPGATAALTATGYYSDGSTRDVTEYATWTSGNPSVASFQPGSNSIQASTVGAGFVAIQAVVAGIANDDAALVFVSSDTAPRIAYAGFADSYLSVSGPSDLTMEVRVADAQNDVLGVVALQGGVSQPQFSFVDNGTGGDRVANDGTWTAVLTGLNLTATGDFRYEAVAVDQPLNQSAMWPYLELPAGSGAAPTPGFPLTPFVSESYGPVSFIAGSGILASSAAPGLDGIVTVVTRVTDPNVGAIWTWLAGVDQGSGMNDDGVGADQIAGDGLWTLDVAVPAPPAGRYIFEFLGASGFGLTDVAPRLRVHQ